MALAQKDYNPSLERDVEVKGSEIILGRHSFLSSG